jgi:hypothetical protein
MMISTVDRLRLAALLGMLGSSHVGERNNAAHLVEQFRRQRGLNWSDLLGRPPADAPAADEGPPSSPREPGPRPFGAGYRIQDLVWRWSMLLGLAAVGLMSLTSLAQQHAAEKRVAARGDATCAAGPCRGSAGGDAAGIAMPAPFVQGLADRKVYEAWRSTAPPGLCSGRNERREWTADCTIARKLLAQFEQRRRADPVYLAGWNSLTQ